MVFRYQILYTYKLHFYLSVCSFQKHFYTPLLRCFLYLHYTIFRVIWKGFLQKIWPLTLTLSAVWDAVFSASFNIQNMASPRRFERPTYCLGANCTVLFKVFSRVQKNRTIRITTGFVRDLNMILCYLISYNFTQLQRLLLASY